MNINDFAKRVLFSRLYLSLEKTRMDGKSLIFAKVHFHWYSLWRLMGLFINRMIKSTTNRKTTLAGSLSGWKMTLGFKFCKSLERNEFWIAELKNNLQQK
jgi:hypothetical protein